MVQSQATHMFMREIRPVQYHVFSTVNGIAGTNQGNKMLVPTEPLLVFLHYIEHILVSWQVFITEVILHLQKQRKQG